jgi:ADP-ribosylglycohydrolase
MSNSTVEKKKRASKVRSNDISNETQEKDLKKDSSKTTKKDSIPEPKFGNEVVLRNHFYKKYKVIFDSDVLNIRDNDIIHNIYDREGNFIYPEIGLKEYDFLPFLNKLSKNNQLYMGTNIGLCLDNAKIGLSKNFDISEKNPDFLVFLRHTDTLTSIWTVITYTIVGHVLGDTIGYHNGHWEFNNDNKNASPEYANELIYEFFHFGGINHLSIESWMQSDDSIMYLATIRALLRPYDLEQGMNQLGENLREEYLSSMKIMENRDPGETVMNSLRMMENGLKWNELQYNSNSIGAGAAMRTGFIGIVYSGEINRGKLVSIAIEASRITHNSTIGFLGGVVAALFTAYAFEGLEVTRWPHELIRLLKSSLIDDYLNSTRPNEYDYYRREKHTFIGKWEKYLNIRFSGTTTRTDKHMINPVTRIKYLADNFSRAENKFFPGSCGDDGPIIAYDALLLSVGNIEKLIVYAMLHPGDSDTTGCMALSWFATYYAKDFNIYYHLRSPTLKRNLPIDEIMAYVHILINTMGHNIYFNALTTSINKVCY